MPEVDRSGAAYTDQLTELVQQRLEILQQLAALQAAWEDAHASDPDWMMSMLAKRQGLLDALLATEGQLTPYREDDPQARVWRSAEQRSECRRTMEEGRRLLRDIIERDRRLIERISAARDAVGAQLRETADSSHVHLAYNASDGLESGVLDITEP